MTKKGPWTVLSSKEVYQNPWLSINEDQVIRPDGKPGIKVIFNIGNGVNILPLDDLGNIYLAKEFQYGINIETMNCASGRVEQGETPLEGAKRELSEELGIEADEWIDLGPISSTPQYINAINHQFLAKKLHFGKAHVDVGEKISLLKIPLEEAVKMVMEGEIVHASSCAAILKTHFLSHKEKERQ